MCRKNVPPVWSARTKQHKDQVLGAADSTRAAARDIWEKAKLLLQPFRGSNGTSTPASQSSATPKSELRQALGACRSAFIGVAIFSGLINILMLTGSLFMLEVYDR